MSDQSKFKRVPAVTKFHRLSRRDGGISRRDAVKKADAAVEKLKSEYSGWLAKDILTLSEVLGRLTEPANRTHEMVTEAYHRARAIRDLGATFGYPAITAVANSFCELLHRFGSNNIYNQNAIDTLMSSLLYVKESEDTEELSTLLFPGLEKVVNRFPAAKS